MVLSKVILKGFKSFADKSEVEIPDGITIFVGPNGCGKSNISDAIRWVMGEQNPRHLRGLRMQDMIFAGAEDRKPESMAEVSLVFDNSDHFFPLPNAEVMISRRLFRSGESEYLLNKAPVRLKDIQELFMDTGMGHHSYTLIEQGRVEHMLNAKPADRLAIFEEAAGVTKYKSRRDEALRKLHRAESELLRLTDIQQELEKQARSLRRQAQQAARQKRLVDEMQSLEEIIGARQAQRMTEERERLEKSKQESETAIEASQNELTTLQTRLADVSLQIDGFTSRLREHHDKRHTVQMEIQKRESELGFLRETEKELAQRRENLEKEIAQGKETRIQLAQNLENKRNQISELENLEASRKEQYEQRSQEVHALRTECRMTEETLEKTRAKSWETQSELLSCRNEIQQIDQQADFLEMQRQRAQKEKESLQSQMDTLLEQMKNVSQEHQAKRTSVEKIRQQLEDLENAIQKKQEETQALAEKLRTEEKDLETARVRLQALEQLDRRFEGYQESARFVLEQKQQGTPPYSLIQKPLADILSVEKGYESAVEAALTSRLECLIVDQAEGASQILDSLASKDLGRVLLLCKEIASRNGQPHYSQDTQGRWKWMKEMVAVADDQRPLVDALLEGTGFVENLSQAIDIFSKENGITKELRCLISRRGDVVSRDGWLAGGRRPAHSVLARKREQSELAEKIAASEKTVAGLSRSLEAARHELERLQGDKGRIRELAEQLRMDLKSLDRDVEAATREQERLQAGLNTLSMEDRERLELKEQHAERRNELDAKEKSLAERESGLQAEVKRLEETLGEQHTVLEKKEKEHRESEVARVSAQKDLERFRAEEENLSKRSTALEERLAQCEQDIVGIEERSLSVGSEKEILKEEIASRLEQSELLQGQIDETESSLKELLSTRESSSSRQREFSQKHEALVTTRNDLDKSLMRVNIEYQNLCDRMKQEIGRDLEELLSSPPEDDRPTEVLEENLAIVRRKIGQLGEVNALAINEYEEVSERVSFMNEQRTDLEKAKASLRQTIERLQRTANEQFQTAFEQIRENFRMVFRKMFRGGKADLVFVDLENSDDGGIEIFVQPPGKHLQNINLLSGGEKALSAIALLFAMYLTKPSPFCLFDEVDAPLDDANIGNFCRMIREFSQNSQFLIITHNKRTMEMASTIYGITMQKKGVSRILSLQLDGSEKQEEAISAAD